MRCDAMRCDAHRQQGDASGLQSAEQAHEASKVGVGLCLVSPRLEPMVGRRVGHRWRGLSVGAVSSAPAAQRGAELGDVVCDAASRGRLAQRPAPHRTSAIEVGMRELVGSSWPGAAVERRMAVRRKLARSSPERRDEVELTRALNEARLGLAVPQVLHIKAHGCEREGRGVTPCRMSGSSRESEAGEAAGGCGGWALRGPSVTLAPSWSASSSG